MSVFAQTIDSASIPAETIDSVSISAQIMDSVSIPVQVIDSASNCAQIVDSANIPAQIINSASRLVLERFDFKLHTRCDQVGYRYVRFFTSELLAQNNNSSSFED